MDSKYIIFLAVFVSTLLVLLLLMPLLLRTWRWRRPSNFNAAKGEANVAEQSLRVLSANEFFSIDNVQFNHYIHITNQARQDPVALQLLRCGFFSVDAKRQYNILRFGCMVLVFISVSLMIWLNNWLAEWLLALFVGLISAGLCYVGASLVLDKIQQFRVRQARRLVPDMLDLLIVCLDAGISLEAAFARVAKEYAVSNVVFAFHLSLLTLEVRAGRPMAQAMQHLAQRLGVQEIHSLAVLFQQSERLGVSVNQTLRVYSEEMRQKRLLMAEEKANQLPVKMLFPMALFIFPVNLLIVLVPVLITIAQTFSGFSIGN